IRADPQHSQIHPCAETSGEHLPTDRSELRGGTSARRQQLILFGREPGGQEGGDVLSRDGKTEVPAQYRDAAQSLELLVGESSIASVPDNPMIEAAEKSGLANGR